MAFVPAIVIAVLWAALSGRISRWWITAAVVLIAVVAIGFFALDPRKKAGATRLDRYEDLFLHQLRDEPIDYLRQTMRDNTHDLLTEVAGSAMFGLKFGTPPNGKQPWHWYTWLSLTANTLSSVTVVALGIGLLVHRRLWGLWVLATLAMMIVVLPHERYFLQILPLMVFAWWQGVRWVNRSLGPVSGNLAFAFLLALGMVPNMLQVGEMILEQQHRPFLSHYKGGKYEPIAAVARQLRSDDVPHDSIIYAPAKTARILSFLGNRTVVEENDAFDVKPAGHRLFVIEDPTDPAEHEWLGRLGLVSGRPVGAFSETGTMVLRQAAMSGPPK
jgi:hypothetical protein